MKYSMLSVVSTVLQVLKKHIGYNRYEGFSGVLVNLTLYTNTNNISRGDRDRSCQTVLPVPDIPPHHNIIHSRSGIRMVGC